MDTTATCETSSEESFDWNDLFNEFKSFQKISNKNVQALADLSEDICKLQLVESQVDTFTSVEEKRKVLSNYLATRNITKEREQINLLKESEKKIVKNIENITNKISSIEEEIEKCTYERKKLRKEYKTSEGLLHKVVKNYETRFDMKLDVKEQSQDKMKAVMSFSNLPPERSVKLEIDFGNEMKIHGMEVLNIGQEKMQYLEKSVQNETKVTPIFCVIRDILNNKS